MNIIEINDLPFDSDSNWKLFTLGECCGYFGETDNEYEIFLINNRKKGNGDFIKSLKWFENKCIQENKILTFSHIENQKFKSHLINKQGFKSIGKCAQKFK